MASDFPHFAVRGAARPSFPARIEGAHSKCALSASKKDGLAAPLIFLRSPALLQGWGLMDLPLRAAFSPAHPLARRDVPLARARTFRFLMPFLEGVAKAALNCAHRTSTFLSCAFYEQRGHLAAPSSLLSHHQ